MASRPTPTAEILAQIPAARARETRARNTGLRATSARYDTRTDRLVVELTNGVQVAYPTGLLPDLAAAPRAARRKVTLSSSGGAIRWPDLDLDYSVAGLILSTVDERARRRHLASLAGRSRSEAKAAAARRNGAKGGRPSASASRTRAAARG